MNATRNACERLGPDVIVVEDNDASRGIVVRFLRQHLRRASVAAFPAWARDANVETVAGDFNGDQRTDLALTGYVTWTSVPVAFSTGAGGFSVTNWPLGSFPGWAATGAAAPAGDFNGDGRSDLALTGSPNWFTIPLALSVGDGQFSVANPNVGTFGDAAAMTGVLLR